VNTYQAAFGEVHDLLFLPGDEQRFVSSAGVKYRDASHQTLLIWDFRSSTLLTERLDRDMQPFQCLRLHPQKPWFVAQCSADYAVLFSSVAPYKKLQKGKARFEGSHEVQGFSIHCSFNRDGSIFATGDANGRLVYYETTTKAAVRSLQAYATPRTACLCTEFHPLEPSTLVTGGSSGDILLYGPPTSSYNNSQPHS
jgi:WD40 repeat protein